MPELMLVRVDVIADTPNDAPPRWYAQRTEDGRWRFTETLVTSSPERAVEYLQHYVTTPPAPLTLELRAIGWAPYDGKHHTPDNGFTPLPDGPRFTSGIENCPYLSGAANRFRDAD